MIGADLTPVTWHSLWTVEGLVALGTLALAFVTAFLAWRTSKMASKTATLATSTEQLAKLTEQDLALSRVAIEADVRPVLVAVPHGEFVRETNYEVSVPRSGVRRGSPDRATVYAQIVEDETLFVSVPFRNEGAGIAFISSAVLRMSQGGELMGEATTTQVPPQGFTRASFAVLRNEQVFTVERLAADGDGFSVAVTYSDLAGNVWATRLRVQTGAPDWTVVGVEISSEGRTDSVIS
jgi:hypothetical protein